MTALGSSGHKHKEPDRAIHEKRVMAANKNNLPIRRCQGAETGMVSANRSRKLVYYGGLLQVWQSYQVPPLTDISSLEIRHHGRNAPASTYMKQYFQLKFCQILAEDAFFLL